MIDLDGHFRFAEGFTYRRETFGGVLFHYEGRTPDPRVTFVDSPFLIGLLQALEAHPQVTPGILIHQAATQFGLTPAQTQVVERFFATCIERGALVRHQQPAHSPGAAHGTRDHGPGVHAPGAHGPRTQPTEPAHTKTPPTGWKGLSAPITATWEITSRCNQRCAHCLSDSRPDADTRHELGLDEARRVVDQLAEARVFQIHFGGGEPFAYPGFMALMEYARSRGFGCLCVSTNGSLLKRQRVNELEALGGIYLQLSLDGGTEETCDALRGRGAFRTVLRALDRLSGRAIVSTVNFVYTRRNAHELETVHDLARAHGAVLRVTRLKPSGRGTSVYDTLRPTREQFAHLYGWLTAHPDVLTGDTFFHLNAFGGALLKGFRSCGAARMTCLITPNGGVYPCAFTQTEPFHAGNLRRQRFADIWNRSPVFTRVFRHAPEGPCTTCPVLESCGGGCPAVKQALVGRMDRADPDCVLEAAQGPHRVSMPLCSA